MVSFEQFWQMLYEHGSRNYYMNAAYVRWNELTPEQQQQLYERIKRKIEQGKYVDYNPLRAMQDNLRQLRQQVAPPKNYNGSREFEAMVQTGTLCTAVYNGQVGIYTIDDANAHHMTIINHLRP